MVFLWDRSSFLLTKSVSELIMRAPEFFFGFINKFGVDECDSFYSEWFHFMFDFKIYGYLICHSLKWASNAAEANVEVGVPEQRYF